MLSPLRNPYAGPVDYPELAQAVPSLAPFLRPGRDGRQTIEFRDAAAIRALNAALLKRDFGLELDLPEDRLCPAVPSRLEYVLFVLQLALLALDASSASSSSRPVVGLDVGTGASAIYPLLAVRTLEPAAGRDVIAGTSSQIRMLATDIDAHSLKCARENLKANNLTEHVSVFQVEPEGARFPTEAIASVDSVDFTMCNPPFYASQSEIDESLAAKELGPFATCTGAESEMITPGGEVAFVTRMVEESLTLGRTKIRWFTSLLGKFSSIGPLVELLKARDILNYHVHALPPHGHTVRWVLAWSLQDRRFPFELLPSIAQPAAPIPPSSTPRFPLGRFASPATASSTYYTPACESGDGTSTSQARRAVEAVLRELNGGESTTSAAGETAAEDAGERASKRRRTEGDTSPTKDGALGPALEWRWDPRDPVPDPTEGGEDAGPGRAERAELFLHAWRNVWSRKARRRGASTGGAAPAGSARPPRPLLELRIILEHEPAPSTQVRLTAHWTRGLDADRAAFTGLFGFVTRKVGERLKAEAGTETGVAAQERGIAGGDGD